MPLLLRSGIVYKFQYGERKATNNGQTKHHFKVRMWEFRYSPGKMLIVMTILGFYNDCYFAITRRLILKISPSTTSMNNNQ